MHSRIKELIQKARLKFFRRDFEFTLFGIMSYKYNWEIKELPEFIEGAVVLHKETNEVKNDNILLNSKFLEKPDYTHDNLIGLVIHEFLHIFHKHGKNGKNKNHELWNLACDHIIDRDCKKMNVNFYNDQFNIIDELNAIKPNCDVFDAYEWLLQNKKSFQISVDNDGDGGDGGSGKGIKITNNNDGQQFIVRDVPGNISNMSEFEANILNEKTDQIINNSRLINDLIEQKNQGSSSSTVKTYLKKLLEIKLDWAELLEKAIKTNTIMKPNDRSWRKLNQYYLPHNITLPGYSMEEENDGVGLLVIWIDTSGSISKHELEKFSSITYNSLKYFEEIQILVHNVKIVQLKKFNKENYIEYIDFINSTGFDTGGGTSHVHCYDYVEDVIWGDKELKDKFSMVISLTDGISDINNCLSNSKYTWLKSVPTVFISTTSQTFENKELNTITICIE